MKRMLFVTTIGGFLQQFEMEQVNILRELGYELYYASDFDNMFYSHSKGELVKSKVRTCHISIKKYPWRIAANLRAILQIKRIIDTFHIDIIHCNNPVGGVCGRVAARLSKMEPYVVYTAHGFHFYKGAPIRNWLIYYPVERFLARYTDVLVTINREDYRRALHFNLKDNGYVIKVNGMGVDKKRYKPMPDIRDEVRHELSIPDGALHIITAAELNDNKNQCK